ncbi:PaaI family thioesterase [Burkholderia sp. BCC1993]|uniref:PaaI family thioesterase n=1 Tax=Burkholderia sp. BCC1993 TaxID=2817444 RepID=UPI002AAFE81D|nr:PaaI family thioesterase [Burkholderia sp. BCC1993]
MEYRAPDLTEQENFFGIEVPFMRLIGLRPCRIGSDECVTFLPIRHDLINSQGNMHGGTLLSVLDFTMSAAARSHEPYCFSVATINLNTQFLEYARKDITIVGKCIKRGKSISFCEGAVKTEGGRIIATATGVFKLFALPKSGV